MADLNALIAQGYQFQAPPDPFVQYGKMQQLENSAMQNQLARQQMTEGATLAPYKLAEIKAKSSAAQLELKQAQDAQDFVNGIMQKVAENHGGINDPMEAAQQMLLNPNPKVQMIGKNLAEAHQLVEGIKQQRAYAQGEPGTGGFAGIPAAPAPGAMPIVPKAAGPVDLAPAAPGEVGTPVLTGNALAPPSVNAMQPNRLAQIDKRLAFLRPFSKVPEAVQERADLVKERDRLMTPYVVGDNLVTLGGGAAFTAPAKAAALPSMVAEYTFAKTLDGGNFKGSYQDFVTARAAAGRAPPAPRPEQPPVAVIDPKTGKPVLVTREQSFGMTPASAQESLPPKEIQNRESKFPAATSAVKTFESSAEKLATDLERLAAHPGLSGISGLVYGRTPAITKDARAAQALYDSIVARGGFQELQNMRASSPTGGALGNVSNQEGQYLRDAFAPINRTQDTVDLSRSLKDAAIAARTSKQRVRDAYDMTYEYKTGGSAAPVAPQGTGGFKYLGKE